jgi:peptide/nickel transport system substrate-binding protein
LQAFRRKAKARKIYPRPASLRSPKLDRLLDCGNNQPAADICQAVAVMLTQIGIKTRPNIVPIANYFPKIEKYDTSFYLISWGAASTSDALYTLQSLLHSATGKTDDDLNLGRYSNPKMYTLIKKVKVESDMKERNEYIREALLLIPFLDY